MWVGGGMVGGTGAASYPGCVLSFTFPLSIFSLSVTWPPFLPTLFSSFLDNWGHSSLWLHHISLFVLACRLHLHFLAWLDAACGLSVVTGATPLDALRS